MKNPVSSIWPILFCFAFAAVAPAQNMPAPAPYPAQSMVRPVAPESGMKLIVAGNTLIPSLEGVNDLGIIPAEPETVTRGASAGAYGSKHHMPGKHHAPAHAGWTKMSYAVLLGVLAALFAGGCKLVFPRPDLHLCELRNFPKKRLAHRGAHA